MPSDDSPSDERPSVRGGDIDLFDRMRATYFEMHGARGNGGAWLKHIQEDEVMHEKVAKLETFQTKVITTISVGTVLASTIVGLLVVALEHLLK